MYIYIPPRLASSFILLTLLLHAVLAWRDCPTPRCNFCHSATVHDAPGIGFDLTTSYGTAVAHLYNGTVLDIAQVPASPAYRDLFERLGNAPAPEPPSRLTQWQRWWNKKRGLPSTATVGVLSSLLSDLKSAAAAVLSEPISHVAVTHPPIPALTQEDLNDALAHAGLVGWLGDSGGHQPKRVVPSQASFAGNGYGVCTDYLDVMECWEQGLAQPRREGLFISLTGHALYASVDEMQEAFPRWRADGPMMLEFGAGMDGRGRFGDEGKYWAYIRSRIVALISHSEKPVDVLLLGGENGTDAMFLATLRDALALVAPGLVREVDVEAVTDLMFAAARGMALYARRRQEVPGHCMERDYCDEEREKQRAGEAKEKEEL